jgi:hypothetical protein
LDSNVKNDFFFRLYNIRLFFKSEAASSPILFGVLNGVKSYVIDLSLPKTDRAIASKVLIWTLMLKNDFFFQTLQYQTFF